MNIKKEFLNETNEKINHCGKQIPAFQGVVSPALPTSPKKMKTGAKITLIVSCSVVGALVTVVAIPAGMILLAGFHHVSSYKSLNNKYAVNEIGSGFTPLNTIAYPSLEKKSVAVSEDFKNSALTFANNLSSHLPFQEDNFSYAPMGLYSNLAILSLASANASVSSSFDALLASSESLRQSNYKKFYENDYYVNAQGSCQLYNGLFLSDQYGTINTDFINKLSDYYCEAFSLDFSQSSEVNKMMDWVDQRMGIDKYVTPEAMDIQGDEALAMLTAFTFNNHWEKSYQNSDTYEDLFYLTATESVKANYMKHIYLGTYYDYGDYFSFYDHYANGMKIKYLVSKSNQNTIFSLLDGVNMFLDDASKAHENNYIECAIPKFASDSLVDFVAPLSEMGYSSLFDSLTDSLSGIYESAETPIYLSSCRQKNHINFTEDGTKITSLTWSIGMAGSPAPMEGDISVQLNQPFIYIIYDDNGLPLYAGSVTNPR